VKLVVAAAAVIPKVVGAPVATATRDLEQLGAHVVVQRVYRPSAAVDTVLDVSPAAGQPAAANVVLTVAAPPAAVNLADLRPVRGNCSEADTNVNGLAYHHSLRCSATATARDVEFMLNRRTVRLTAVIGQDDRATPGQTVHFVISGDGKVLAAADLKYGESKAVDLDTSSVLRLTLSVQLVAPAPGTYPDVAAIFGDVKVIGGPADVVALTETAS
jgi:hypothetical protein